MQKNIIIVSLLLIIFTYSHASERNLIVELKGGFKQLITCGFLGNQTIAFPTDDNCLMLYDINNSTPNKVKGHQTVISAYDQSSSGHHFATGSYDGYVYQYDGLTIEMNFSNTDHSDVIRSIRFSADESVRLTASWDNIITAYNTQTGKRKYYFKPSGGVVTVAPSSNADRIAVSLYDQGVELWEIDQFGYPTTYAHLVDHTDNVYSIDWHPHDTVIATGSADSSVKLWDAELGKNIFTLTGAAGTKSCLRYSNDGNYLAVANKLEGSIVVYDAKTLAIALRLAGHTGGTDAIGWSLDDTKIVSCSDNEKKIKVWSLTQ